MIKILGKKVYELELLMVLAEYPRLRVFLNYPVKGRTKKVRGKELYKVVNFPCYNEKA